MAKRRKPMIEEDTGENFWPSFTDLISTVALILFVLVLLAYIQNLVSGKNLAAVRAQLSATLSRLTSAQASITSSETRLKALGAEIAAGQAQLALSQAKISAQEAVIGQSTLELSNLRTRLQGIALLRIDVLDNVRRSLEAQLGKGFAKGGPLVAIAENGNIVINESLLFEYNSANIKPEGRRLLDTLATAFAGVLSEDTVRANIDTILVQGHSDERGSVSYNRELSAKRATTVLNYMFEANPKLEQSFGAYFAASAYSESRPVSNDKSEAGYERNRRIEISLVLKDANVRGLIDEYMRNVQPQPPTQGAPSSPSP
jgi:chemotaxis protein MotB